MKNRILSLPTEQSFFLFGARNTGKSTLIKQLFSTQSHLWIDLLDPRQERTYFSHPEHLEAEVLALPTTTRHIIIDEVQKLPKLLDVVHRLIESTDKIFVLTGSSARKLRRGHANLLAGRAAVRYLYPFTFIEQGADFKLIDALTHGVLPKVTTLTSTEAKADFLRGYTHTYLKEEVWAEHLIRKLDPFHYFLEVAAQSNGQIINFSKIARDVGVDEKTIQQYYSILEDTLLGFYLTAYRGSFRKRLTQKPKFYFFDVGVTRTLCRTMSIPVHEGTYEFGNLFEHYVILMCLTLAKYHFPDFRFSYFRTHDDLEIDLVVDRPNQPTLLLEIKSAQTLKKEHVKTLQHCAPMLGKVECICLARIERRLKFDNVTAYPWQEGITKFFTASLN